MLSTWLSGKESAYNAGDFKFDPWTGKIPCRRKRQPTPVSLPGKFHGQRSLAGYSPWVARVGHNLMTKPEKVNCVAVNSHSNSWYSLKNLKLYSIQCSHESLAEASSYIEYFFLYVLRLNCVCNSQNTHIYFVILQMTVTPIRSKYSFIKACKQYLL